MIIIIPRENVVSKNPKVREREREFFKVFLKKKLERGRKKKIFEIDINDLFFSLVFEKKMNKSNQRSVVVVKER